MTLATKLFVNLPVRDLPSSIEFFTRLGYEFDDRFTDDTATCLVVSDEISVMLLTHERFKSYSPNAICDATKNTEVLLCLVLDSRRAVDEMISNATAAGGRPFSEPHDTRSLYGHRFQDLDGHVWELLYITR